MLNSIILGGLRLSSNQSILTNNSDRSNPDLICSTHHRSNYQDVIINLISEDIRRWHNKVRGVLVVASEGLLDEQGESIANTGILDGFGHKIPGGVGQALANILIRHGIKSRSEKPGLLGRNSIALQSAVDREEAIRVGAYAVQTALAGKGGYMVAIKRVSDHPYQSELELVPLDKVANRERRLPDRFINRDGNGIDPSFAEYCLPLLGGPLPEYANLTNMPIEGVCL